MGKNIFILGLTDLQREELGTVRDAENYRFHGLLDYHTLVAPDEYVFEDLLTRCREKLDAFPGTVDAIIAHWDFPTSVLAPILAAERGIPAPPLRSVLACEHKYWSRLAQQESVPDAVPRFASFDPFDDHALDSIGLEFPFWVKPVKSHSSQLGFEIGDAAAFHEAIAEIRERIGLVGHAFDEALRRVDLPEAVRGVSGTTCLAEQVITGIQAAPEGTMFNGEFSVHGVFDMHKDATGHSFDRLDYPASTVPLEVQQRMIDITERYLRHVGFDNGCFNSEFMWDEKEDKLWLIEVNTRISQSHSDLFAKVDGMSNHEVAIDIALGTPPRMQRRHGTFGVAAKCIIPHYEDGIVTRVPSNEDIARVQKAVPETKVLIDVRPGDRLADLPNQDAYRYVLGTMYIGADDIAQLEKHVDRALAELPFEFEPVPNQH
ncbi:ATP-grasp domain-containing protein [Rhodococcus oxybenzonivorans]|uniref:ATP-grasp domain-containing protein n=1 Tax=Rhodococcus oxybenzonivorans TaxID=1990687 RepID=UPI002953E8D2|nr:ATP-grasp domain-containing protein [Rhodococcus oxybenzonivorans]MDV7351699.1 ATP-grasp domain-containing protein [Rhodococcus oxybenzonivorans]